MNVAQITCSPELGFSIKISSASWGCLEACAYIWKRVIENDSNELLLLDDATTEKFAYLKLMILFLKTEPSI